MSKLYPELLNENQAEVLGKLNEFARYGVLGGGTALMFQLGHRKSYDFDIFLPKLISKKFVYKIKEVFEHFNLIIQTGDEFSFVSLPEKVKVTFIYYPYSPLFSRLKTEYLDIFSWKDVALDKAHTIGRRGEWRDYVDLYFIIKKGFSLSKIIDLSKKKFGDSFSEKLFLSQLVYFGDVEDFTMELIKEELPVQNIQDFIKNGLLNYF